MSEQNAETKKPEEVEAEVVTDRYASPGGPRPIEKPDPFAVVRNLFKPGSLPYGLSPGLVGVAAAVLLALIVGVMFAQSSSSDGGRVADKDATTTANPSVSPAGTSGPAFNAPPASAPQNDVGDAIDLSSGQPLGAQPSLHAAPQFGAPPAQPAIDAPAAAPSLSPSTGFDPSKVGNDIGAVKEAFAAETQSLSQALAAARAQNAEQQRQIQELASRLEKIEGQEGTTSAGRQAAASLALLSLQRVVASGGPYQTELDILARLLPPGAPAVDRLRPKARDGAATLAALKLRFDETARTAMVAEASSRSNSTAGGVMARLESLVSVRPARPVSGSDAKAVISRAEDQLDKNALDKAVRELETLKGPASEAFAAWLADARGRLSVDQAIEEINGVLLKDYTN